MATPTSQTAVNTAAEREGIVQLLRDFTLETTPKSAHKVAECRQYIQDGTWIYVTALPGQPYAETIDACILLAKQGMRPVPHFTARSIADHKTLDHHLARLTGEAGVTRVLALAGANKQALGDFPDSISMLRTGLFDRHGIQSIGIAGHPEGSPDINQPELREHGRKKIHYAELSDTQMYLITQFVFKAKPIVDWVQRIRSEGNELPVVVGIPGLASLKSLLSHAKACGIGASMNVLSRQAKNVHKLLSPQAPDKLIRDLAAFNAASPERPIAGLHMYPLGGLLKTAKWSQAVAAGAIELDGKGGFSVAE